MVYYEIHFACVRCMERVALHSTVRGYKFPFILPAYQDDGEPIYTIDADTLVNLAVKELQYEIAVHELKKFKCSSSITFDYPSAFDTSYCNNYFYYSKFKENIAYTQYVRPYTYMAYLGKLKNK